MDPRLQNTPSSQNVSNEHSVQFESDEGGLNQGGYSNITNTGVHGAQGFSGYNLINMTKHKKIPFLYRILVKSHLAKDVKQAQKIEIAVMVVLLLVSVYFFSKALAPHQVVQIKFK